MNKIVAVLVLSLIATTPAFAWGEREQGVLTGVAGLLLLQHVAKPNIEAQPPHVYGHSPVWEYPHYSPSYHRPTYIHRPMYKAVDIYFPECNCYRTVMIQIN